MTNLSPNEYQRLIEEKIKVGRNGWERLMLHAFYQRHAPGWNAKGRQQCRDNCRAYIVALRKQREIYA
jgi:hypothetical protein